jgi:hypothetical protein
MESRSKMIIVIIIMRHECGSRRGKEVVLDGKENLYIKKA